MSASSPATDAGYLPAYLAALFGRARAATLVEVRWRTPRGMGQRFVAVSQLAQAQAVIARLAPATDVYVGVLPRWRRAGGRAAIVGDCRTVWVDLDLETAARALEPVEPAPNLVVASGAPGHLHAYWLLRTAIAPIEIERANRRLAWAIGGDLSSADAARILRPPDTVNHRRDAAPVRLQPEAGSDPCRLADLVGGLPDPSSTRASVPASRPRADPSVDWLRSVAPDCYVAALTGRVVGRDRKVCCPLHPDRTPSLHVYDDPDRGWYCFGCRRGGGIYDLAGALWNIEPRGAGMKTLRDGLERLL